MQPTGGLQGVVQAGADKAVEVIAQGVGAGDVAIDLRFRFARDGGGFGCKGLGLRARAAVACNLRWRKLRHLKFTLNRPSILTAQHSRIRQLLSQCSPSGISR
ncbi:hypothetical protein POHY109586_14755 [Polaromonas hydrogenivorans]